MKKRFLLPLLFISFAQAQTISCQVSSVIDGDTISCVTDQKESIKVGLYQVSAPKGRQNYAQESKIALSDMILGENIHIEIFKKDKNKRSLGTVLHQKKCPEGSMCILALTDINQEMIRQGCAWYYPFDKKNSEYIKAEQEAKAAKRGLWSQKNPVQPWVRQKKK